jgi:hypothetical protein
LVPIAWCFPPEKHFLLYGGFQGGHFFRKFISFLLKSH